MSKIGVHSFVWSAGSTKDELERTLERSHELGFKLVEFSYLDPKQVDVNWLASRIRQLGLDVAVSMGLPTEGDISSEDGSVVANGEAILDRAVALVRDLGGTKLAGILSSSHGKQERALSRKGWDKSVSTLSKVNVLCWLPGDVSPKGTLFAQTKPTRCSTKFPAPTRTSIKSSRTRRISSR